MKNCLTYIAFSSLYSNYEHVEGEEVRERQDGQCPGVIVFTLIISPIAPPPNTLSMQNTVHSQYPSSPAAPHYVGDPDDIFGKLFANERQWRDRQLFLESKGYMLRPRLRPGWTPSWKTSKKSPLRCEDCLALPARTHLVDATAIASGKLVYIKRIQTGDLESSIAVMLSNAALRADPRNHSVPVLDVFQDDEDPRISYMVMPFLRRMDSPEFETVGEVVDFVDQILEGLLFLHENGVAHRDCARPNLMMDADRMYPSAFHPLKDRFLLDDITTPTSYIPRSQTVVKYYFVDFGISSYIPSNSEEKLVFGVLGRDQEVPELSNEVPYDPFKADVFIIGNVLRREFHDVFHNVDFLAPLINAMTREEPNARLTAAAALAQWKDLKNSIPLYRQAVRVKKRDEQAILSAVLDTMHVANLAMRYIGWAMGLD
ncbi:hypothetical protein OF83DRAFT_1088003 [Amylostereum chailletii]|nr:hypothetical protein OF83DRAFT_1088003 [Amylostereum chailletii]